MPEYFDQLLRAPLDPLGYLFAPDQRVYAVFLVGSLVPAVLFYWLKTRPNGAAWRGLLGYLFPRRVWLHRSALADYRLLFANAIVRTALFAPVAVPAVSVAAGVASEMEHWLGPGRDPGLAPTTVASLFTFALFVADDLSRYLVHRAMHCVPFLWEFHKVHHSAEVLTPFTLYRQHPLEIFVMMLRGALTAGVVTGAFFYVFRESLHAFEIAGINALVFGLNLVGANLRHSHVRLSYGRKLEHLLVSPAQHQLHHSACRHWQTANYGSFLAVWDWLGGTWRPAAGATARRFGLARHDRSGHGHSVRAMLGAPVVAALRGGERERGS